MAWIDLRRAAEAAVGNREMRTGAVVVFVDGNGNGGCLLLLDDDGTGPTPCVEASIGCAARGRAPMDGCMCDVTNDSDDGDDDGGDR